MELLAQVLHPPVEQRALPGVAQVEGPDRLENPGGVAHVGALDLVVEGLGHGVAPLQHRRHRRVEPAVDRSLKQLGGDGEEEEDGDQRHADIGRHQLELERRAQHPVAALDQQLDEVAQQDEEDGQDEDDVDVPEDEQQDLVGDQGARQVAPPLGHVEQGREQQQEGAQAAEDEAVVLAVVDDLLAQAHG